MSSAVALLAWGSAALAMDCGRASTTIEKAICADSGAKAQDAQLGRLYFATLKTLSGQRHATLIEDQRLWLDDRSQSCGARTAGMVACVTKMTTARIAQIKACYEGGAPDASAGSMSCAVAVHATCPRSKLSASAAVWSYPFLVAKLDEMVASRKKVPADADLCVPESKDRPGTPDQNDEQFEMTLEGAGPGWVAVRSTQDDDFRGAAHPQHWEQVTTYEVPSGKLFPITRLLPKLASDPDIGTRLWEAASAVVSKPCCGDDGVAKADLDDDTRYEGTKDPSGHVLPSAWSIQPDGALKVYYDYDALGRRFVATSVLKRSVFIQWVAARYAPLFGAKR